ncbi:hypothetical protein DUNSADRAFT_9426 [Dunaliella salina]|uniref:Leucine-rich repeat-containing N-terminal plant-type domain-containing protein n=1 Tax=Dunaliella salina TaxID=3046 RepID=A0ABQ7GHF0_DUNSA|nr:hypothetical protein DUNSADRAFT_9426 [Dunaliella salina]|eukprot:KAF5834035.1 hypothetical protein DUNSADRAFT_9426 [Dunaliella salina]
MFPRLLLLSLFVLATASANKSCTASEQQQALLGMYSAHFGGPNWHNRDGWLDTSVECMLEGSPFPAHCCWHGIKCCLSSTCLIGNLSIPPDQCGCEPGLVWEINQKSNNLVGNFTSFKHRPFACSLHKLVLSDNYLSGVISQDVEAYKQLSSMDLQSNKLQGNLPEGLGQLSSLRHLHLSSNLLEGAVPASICGNARKLTSLAIDDNQLSGPLDLSWCRQLTYISAKGNRFLESGTPEKALPGLRSAFFDDNSLRGALPDDLFASALPHLEEMGFSGNLLSGRLPDMSMYSLKKVVLGDNRFVGAIPDSWSRMAHPYTLVRLDTNYLSCCGTEPLLVILFFLILTYF